MTVKFNIRDLVEKLKDTIRVDDFVKNEYGARLERTGKGFLCCSPLREDKHPSFSIDKDGRLWYDFATSEGGDIIKLVCLHDNVDFKTAVDTLQKYAGITYGELSNYTPRPRTKTRVEQLDDEMTERYLDIESINAEMTRIHSGKANEELTEDEAQKIALLISDRDRADAEINDIQRKIAAERRKEADTDISPESAQAKDHNSRASDEEPMIYQYKPDDLSDLGVVGKFASVYKNDLKYTEALGWLYWDGRRWTPSTNIATSLAKQLAINMRVEAATALSKCRIGKAPEDITAYSKLAERLQNKLQTIKQIPEFVKHDLTTELSQFDSAAELLNTPAGVVNLRTGDITPHNPKQLNTKITSVAPSTEPSQEWNDFLDLITGGDKDLIFFLQTVAGMAAIGKPTEFLIIAKGGGRNGKSTFFNALLKVLGDYSATVSSDLLTLDDRQNKMTQYANLRGARLVVCGELEEGTRLSTATLKKVASTDPIVVKRLYHDEEQIFPTHSIILYTNHYPHTTATDMGTWRRLLPVPFNQVMPTGESEITNYDDYLKEHCGGAILQWIIEGAAIYLANGSHLTEPDCVKREKNEYRTGEDWLQDFINDKCIAEAGTVITTGSLYRAYQEYAKSRGDYPRNRRQFTDAMIDAGYTKVTGHARVDSWLNIHLVDDGFSPVRPSVKERI